MFDNSEIEEILEKLESMEDEAAAAALLREYNERSKVLGKLLMNLDSSLSHEQWKAECDQAKAALDQVLEKIRSI